MGDRTFTTTGGEEVAESTVLVSQGDALDDALKARLRKTATPRSTSASR